MGTARTSGCAQGFTQTLCSLRYFVLSPVLTERNELRQFVLMDAWESTSGLGCVSHALQSPPRAVLD